MNGDLQTTVYSTHHNPGVSSKAVMNTIPLTGGNIASGWGWGYSHIRNLDGTVFTFNGQGEYYLMKIEESGFVLQGRMEPASESMATTFTALAFGLPTENIVVEVGVMDVYTLCFS